VNYTGCYLELVLVFLKIKNFFHCIIIIILYNGKNEIELTLLLKIVQIGLLVYMTIFIMHLHLFKYLCLYNPTCYYR
jgi:hypothetical protein